MNNLKIISLIIIGLAKISLSVEYVMEKVLVANEAPELEIRLATEIPNPFAPRPTTHITYYSPMSSPFRVDDDGDLIFSRRNTPRVFDIQGRKLQEFNIPRPEYGGLFTFAPGPNGSIVNYAKAIDEYRNRKKESLQLQFVVS